MSLHECIAQFLLLAIPIIVLALIQLPRKP
jgi:hypothetical protein